ncbi:hypothetical protein [Floridanema aerugineum]|uniref:Uncharacterized protein n=1 Tax=Floridaenema aerugineum BLCC-F46 TaxID=3153654 RepID=A0ABV4X397_9CYAN
MREIEAKNTVVESVEEIETEIIDALASKVDGADLMVIEVNDETFIPLFQEALSNTKQLFLDTTTLPVLRLKPPITQSNLVLALVSLALANALDALDQVTDQVTDDREEWKKVVFDRAALIIANSSPEVVSYFITKEFEDLIVDFLAKS